jgi:hypothetical protein
MHTYISLLLILHGIAHLPGFLVPWRLMARAGIPYSTTVLNGTADLGVVGIRTVSLLWLLAAVAFIVAGAATLLGDHAWRTLALAATVASLAALTIAGISASGLRLGGCPGEIKALCES